MFRGRLDRDGPIDDAFLLRTAILGGGWRFCWWLILSEEGFLPRRFVSPVDFLCRTPILSMTRAAALKSECRKSIRSRTSVMNRGSSFGSETKRDTYTSSHRQGSRPHRLCTAVEGGEELWQRCLMAGIPRISLRFMAFRDMAKRLSRRMEAGVFALWAVKNICVCAIPGWLWDLLAVLIDVHPRIDRIRSEGSPRLCDNV